MRIPQIIPTLMLTGCALICGCQSGPADKTPTQKALAQQQWNDARASVLGGLALDQYKNGSFDKCQASLDEALPLSPSNVGLHLLAAKLAIEQGKLEQAESQLDLARKADGQNAEVDYLDGVVLQRWQQSQKAQDAYAAAVQKNPAELSYLMAQSEMLVALHKPQEAVNLLKSRLVYFEHSAAIRDAAGQLLVEQGNYAEAVDLLREASILASDDLTVREHLGFALYYAKQSVQAGEVFERLLKDDSYSKRADIDAALGQCQEQAGRLTEARESFETAARLDPACIGYWLGLGRTACESNDLARADLAVRKAISIDATNPSAQCLLGYVRLREDRLTEALSAFKSGYQQDSFNLCMQGYVLKKMGRNEEARTLFTKVLAMNPGDELASKLSQQ